MRSKQQMLEDLDKMLEEAFSCQTNGGDYARLTRVQGLIDGYMRALLDSGMVSHTQLLEMVAARRAAVHGPATRTVELDELDIAAA